MSLLGWLEDPPANRGLHWFDAGAGSWQSHRYPAVAELTRRAATRFLSAGVRPGDRVVIIRSGSPDFIADFFGALLVGATPSPIAPPATTHDQPAYLEHVRRVVDLVEPRVLATTEDVARTLVPRTDERSWPCVVLSGVPSDAEPLESFANLPEIGVIRFSSGSTGRPRGIRVPFGALEAQTRMLHQWLRIDAGDVYANWLPVHQDMGLQGLVLLPLWEASDLWSMRPEDFIRDPLAWLARFGRGDATLSSMPPFGMAHIVREVPPSRLEGFDFSRWRSLITGSERIDVRVVDAFLDLLGQFGFRRRTITPAYGMAEAMPAVTGIPVTDEFRTYDCDASSLVLGAAVRPPTATAEPAIVMGCGSPLPGMSVRVVDAGGAEVGPGVLGEIEVGSASLAAGCLTEDGAIPMEGPWRTGDAGFLHAGELFVVGRLGDALKQFGRWFFAENIERVALSHSPSPHQTVALVGTLAERSTVAILVACAVTDPERIGQAVARQAPGMRVLVLSVHASHILRTTGGKPQRARMWRELAEGRYEQDRLWDSDTPQKAASAGLDTIVGPVEKTLRVYAAAADRDGTFPVDSLGALRTSGLMGLLVPRAYGGLGGDTADLVTVGGQLAGACLSTALIWVMHCQQVDAIVRFGTPALRERLLPRIALDGAYLASITAERATGGDLLRAHESLVREGDGYRLTRSAPVVTGGAHADGYLVKMRSSPDASSHDVSLVYVDRAQAEVETGPGWDALGMRAAENVSLRLTGVVPDDQIVGGLGGFRRVAIDGFAAIAHIGWSAIWLGAARSAFSELLREIRAGSRIRLDTRSELTASRIAAIRSRLEMVSSYLHVTLAEVTGRQDRGLSLEPAAVQIHLNTLKILAARETYAAADAMITLSGLSTGYLKGSPLALERLLRDLRAASLMYDDSRLEVANGVLSLLDPTVTLAGAQPAPARKEALDVE